MHYSLLFQPHAGVDPPPGHPHAAVFRFRGAGMARRAEQRTRNAQAVRSIQASGTGPDVCDKARAARVHVNKKTIQTRIGL